MPYVQAKKIKSHTKDKNNRSRYDCLCESPHFQEADELRTMAAICMKYETSHAPRLLRRVSGVYRYLVHIRACVLGGSLCLQRGGGSSCSWYQLPHEIERTFSFVLLYFISANYVFTSPSYAATVPSSHYYLIHKENCVEAFAY